MNEFEFIFESLRTAREKYLDTDIIPEDIFKKFEEGDPSKNKKYLEWMCKQYSVIQERPEHIVDVINVYDSLVSRNVIKEKDINAFKSLTDVEELISTSSKTRTKTEIKKSVKKDADVVLDNENYFIIVPKSHEASKVYGKNTKWCTTYKSREYWDKYTDKGVKFYYIVNKADNKKYAVAVYLDGTKEVYDEKDDNISYNELKQLLGIK